MRDKGNGLTKDDDVLQEPDHGLNFKRLAAIQLMRNKRNPCLNRLILVDPYSRSLYRMGTSIVLSPSFVAPKIRSKSPKGSKSPKKDRLANILL